MLCRLLAFDEEDREFSLILQTGYHGNCVLQVDHIIYSGEVLVLSAATDGRIAVWNLTHECYQFLKCHKEESDEELCDEPNDNKQIDRVPVKHFRAHQSGVNSLHIWKRSGECQQ